MSLKVFDLQCATGHMFEGWFGSADDYTDQLARGMLICPVCSDADVVRRPSAARLNLSRSAVSGTRRSAGLTDEADPGESPSIGRDVPTREACQVGRLQAALLRQVRQIINSAENVGPRFAEEARRRHDSDEGLGAIRGTATASERQALADDGIEVVAVPDFLDDDRMQ